MRVRITMVVAAMVAAAATSLSVAHVASAQGSVEPAASPLANDAIFTPPVVSKPACPPPRPPAVLGERWARAMRAVLDEVKRLVDAEWIEAAEIGGTVARADVTPPPPVPAWRTAWTPASALREQVTASPVRVTPVPIEPPTETPVDTRGQHAVLLGVKMELPWMEP
jgi:hypothetical protein